MSILIFSLLVITFSQMQKIYGLVATTDNSISSTFNNIYDMYNGRTMTGLGLLNTVKKYEEARTEKIVVAYPGSDTIKEHISKNGNIRESVYLKSLMEDSGQYKYETKYNVTVDVTNDNTTIISFVEIRK